MSMFKNSKMINLFEIIVLDFIFNVCGYLSKQVSSQCALHSDKRVWPLARK